MSVFRQLRLLFVAVLSVQILAERLLAEASLETDFENQISQLSKSYAIDVARSALFPVSIGSGEIDARVASSSHLRDYLPLISSEWNLYPIDLVKRTGVWRIVLCEDMTYKGQPRTAFPDWEHHTLYFDVDVDRHSELRFRKAIHHEFFHMIDYADDGSFEDAQWGALNPKGFKYGIGGASAQRDYSSGDIKLDLPGFLNRYCQTGVEEDKAEMFCYMMVNGKELEEHAATDPIIHAKMQRMKQMLKGFCPEVDEQFWQAARKVPRPSDWPLRSVPVEQNVLPTVNPRHAAGDPRFFVLLRRWIAVGVAIVLVLIATRAIYRSTVVSK